MTYFAPEYNEYATCYRCGLKKYCKAVGNRFVCYSCDHGNFRTLRKRMK